MSYWQSNRLYGLPNTLSHAARARLKIKAVVSVKTWRTIFWSKTKVCARPIFLTKQIFPPRGGFFASKWRWMTSSLSRFLSLSFLLSQLSQAKIKSMLFTLSLRPLVTNNNNSSNSKKCELNWWTPAYCIVFNFGTDTYSFLTSWNITNLAREVW